MNCSIKVTVTLPPPPILILLPATEHGSGSGGEDGQCVSVFNVCSELLLHTNLTTLSCLSSKCENSTDGSTSSRTGKAEGKPRSLWPLPFLPLTSRFSHCDLSPSPLLSLWLRLSDGDSGVPCLSPGCPHCPTY